MVEDRANIEHAPSEGTKLNYIDKVAQASNSNAISLSRVMMLQLILSGLLMAVCTGVIYLDEEYSLLGMKINISLPASLWVGGVILAVLLLATVALLQRQSAYIETLKRLYKDLNYEIPQEITHPFTGSDAITALLTRVANPFAQGRVTEKFTYASAVILIGLVTLLPVATEVTILVTLAQTSVFWVWAPAILLVLVSMEPVRQL